MGRVVTLGEIMLRLSTEQGQRLQDSDHFARIMAVGKRMSRSH